MPETIDGVIAALDGVLEEARVEGSRVGYFPALYRKVTIAVKEGIRDGVFEDGPRMERFDVIFANRYLAAWEAYRRGEPPTASWQAAFEAAPRRMPIVLQHLLMGMNAHINLDLGIAAAEVAPGPKLPELRNDFMKINTVLSSQVDGVKAELTEIWPKLRLLDRLAGSKEDRIINFSLGKARDHAWSLAEELSAASPVDRTARIATADRHVAKLAHLILHPGPLARLTLWNIRLAERGTVRQIIDLLT